MFGSCFHVALPDTHSESSNCKTLSEELPLDLSCKAGRNVTEAIIRPFNERLTILDKSICGNKLTTPSSVRQKDALLEKNDLIVDKAEDKVIPPFRYQTSAISGTASSNKRNRERALLPCHVCGKAFDRPSLLKRHIRTHTGEKPHVCDVCGKGFSTSSSLNTHRRIHSGEKPHQCPICGKRFTASSNLYYHRMTHVKEKPHKCTTCHKSFPTPGDLKSHMYVHSGSWPFHCTVCKRGFSKQTNLRNHLFLHTGKKPHTCSHCGKCFALACNLRAHMRTHSESGQSTVAEVGNLHPIMDEEEYSLSSENTNEHPHLPDDVKTSAAIEHRESAAPTQQPAAPLVFPSSPHPLMDQVLFWHSIQQQLASNILSQQQDLVGHQQTHSAINFLRSPLNQPLKFPK